MKKILVIEDNDQVRENIVEILTLSAYSVRAASNGKEGVDIALKEIPDLVVCDIMMPSLDGYGVLHLLNKHTETADTPFIFLTAKSEKADWRKGMEMGADDYLTKPFDGIELLNAVEIRLKKAEGLKKKFLGSIQELNNFIEGAQQNTNLQLTSEQREVYTYNKNHKLYQEEQRPKSVYFIVSGKVKTYKTNEDGKELITNVYNKGDFLGYLPILQEINYTENAQILEEAELMLIPKEDFLQLITSDTQIARQFIKIISRDILEKEEDLLNLAYNSLRKKVAYGIVSLLDKLKEENQTELSLHLSRETLAQVVGVATESLIRTLADFKSEGLIDIKNRKIIILNEKKLRDLPY